MGVRRIALPFWQTRRGQARLTSLAVLIIALAGSTLVLIPFFWMISTSLKQASQVYLSPPIWLPNPPQWGNYAQAVTRVPFHLYAWNTAVIVGLVTIGTLLSCSLSAYGFARLSAPGKNVIFMLLLSTLMLPGAVTLVPTYLLHEPWG